MREENVKIEKIQKSSKIALTITIVAKIFAIAIAVIACLSGILLIGAKDIIKDIINEEIENGVESGVLLQEELMTGIEGEIGRQLIQDGYSDEIAVDLIEVGAMMICMAVMMHFIGKVFKEMKESYSPFTTNVVKNLKVSFVLITILSMWSSLLIGAVIGFSLWCALHVFEYGCILQKQSDETL